MTSWTTERLSRLVHKTMDTKNDTKETMNHDVKHDRAASQRDPMKLEVVKSCFLTGLNRFLERNFRRSEEQKHVSIDTHMGPGFSDCEPLAPPKEQK